MPSPVATQVLPDGVRLRHTLYGHGGPIGHLAWSSDGSLLATPAADGTISIWGGETYNLLRTIIRAHSGGVWAVAFQPGGHILASGGQDGKTKLWAPDTGTLLSTIRHGSVCNSVAVSQQFIASGCADGVYLSDIKTGKLLSRYRSNGVHLVAFDPTGETLAACNKDGVWLTGQTDGLLNGHSRPVIGIAFHPAGRILATSSIDTTVKLWDFESRRLLLSLEEHDKPVIAVAFSADGRMLASSGHDGLRLWECDTWTCIARMPYPPTLAWQNSLAFHPVQPLLTFGDPAYEGRRYTVQIFEVDTERLIGAARRPAVAYTTAKIVLVGDSGVGKTGLGWRLAHDEYKEHSSTHGQQFWLIDQLGGTRTDGTRCEAILWDLAGQPDYRLTHALFLDDADLALVLFDPARDDDPLHGVDYWLRQLDIRNTGRPVILVAARSDRGGLRLTADEIRAFCVARGLRDYVVTSALDGHGLDELIGRMRAAIAWDDRPTTITTETFKRIKDHVLTLKELDPAGEQVILCLEELRARVEQDGSVGEFTDAEMLTAVGHLSHHGYVSRLRNSRGEPRVLLTPELLNNLASSIVLEARRNPRGLGSLEEQDVLSGRYRFPELDALPEAGRDIMLDSAVAMFLEHNVCFRETDPLSSRVYLVFPELINLKKPASDDTEPVEETVAYTVSGAVEHVYASLVVLLGYTNTFTRTSQWRDHARYVMGDGLVCGFRLEAEREGELDFVLCFGPTVGAPIRILFQSLFESFLARKALVVRRYEQVLCTTGHRLNRAVVRERLTEGSAHVFCPRCGERLSLPGADAPIELTHEQAADVQTQRRAAAQRSLFEQALFRLKAYVTQDGIPSPECFVSYAWGDPAQEHWVEHTLADDLTKAGVSVVLDKWENARIGASVPRFLDRVASADRVIVIGTPRYRLKYANDEPMRGFVVAAEGDLIGQRMIGTEADKSSVLPVLLDGEPASSFPPLLQGRVYADFRAAEHYFDTVFQLILSLYEVEPRHPVSEELRQLLHDGR